MKILSLARDFLKRIIFTEEMFSTSQFKRGRNQSLKRNKNARNNGPACAAHQTAASFMLLFEKNCISEANLGPGANNGRLQEGVRKNEIQQ